MIGDMNSSTFECTCSTIGTSRKALIADVTPPLGEGILFSRFTVKVRSMGTNTYIGIGGINQGFRFTAANQSHTYIAPIHNGSVVPLSIHSMNVIGDGATGVVEVTGITIYECRKGCRK